MPLHNFKVVRRGLLTIVVSGLTIAPAVALGTPAIASDGKSAPPGYVVIAEYPSGYAYGTDPQITDKSKVGGTLTSPAPGPQPLGIDVTVGWLNPYGKKYITPPGGSSSQINAAGSTKVVKNVIPCVSVPGTKFVSSSSEVRWEGQIPFRATTVTSTDYWSVSNTSLNNVSIGNAPSGSIVFGYGAVEWSESRNNEWRIIKGWNEVRFGVAVGTIYHADYNVTGGFQFGNYYQRVTGYSGFGIGSCA